MQQTILPHQLPMALDLYPGAKLLSLDCFDTLLWRDVHAPADLFALLGDISANQRIRAEYAARKVRALDRQPSNEVTLREIYDQLLPHADAAVRAAAVARELALETRHCYAFAPTVALIRAAKARGLPVVIVSDTYFERDQLAALIRHAAGEAVVALIDRIFCSCDYRSAKSERLFKTVVRTMGVRADRILHIGDNPHADRFSADRDGLRGVHLVQFGETTVQRLRQEATVGAMMLPGGAAFMPHRAALAVGEPGIDDPGAALGYGVLGPVLTTFAHWIAAEKAAAEAARGGRAHLLFLMRDGHLPREAFMAAMPGVPSYAVEISRFAATAAALRDPAAVRRFVLEEMGDSSGMELLRQLLIEDDEARALIATLPAKDRALALADAVTSPRWLPTIVARAQAYADRMIGYLRRQIAPAPGDTIILIDIGYNATVQNRINALLVEAFGVHVAGRYLILSETEQSGLDKRGLLDRSWLDASALQAIVTSVAVLEQFCTVARGSVVDYDAAGAPIHAAAGIKGRQSEVRAAVQAGCIAYARAAGAHAVRVADPGIETHRRAAAATLSRLMFLPLPHELQLMARFEHDANLGTDDKVALFDPEIGARGLRERGLFYLKNARRMYLPAEVRGQGLPTSLMLLAQRRFDLDLRYADFCDREIALPVLIADGTEAFADTIRATPTHDGWFLAAVPVGACRYTVGLQFGRAYEWLQIDSVRFLPVAAFLAGEEATSAVATPAVPSCEGMDQIAPHLFHCADDDSFLMVPPPADGDPRVPMMLTVVFRPIAARETAAPAPAAPALQDGAVL